MSSVGESMPEMVKQHWFNQVLRNGNNLKHTPYELKCDREIVLAALSSVYDGKCPSFLRYAALKLKADREFVLAAVKMNGWALMYAAPELKADRAIVRAAVAHDGWALLHAADELERAPPGPVPCQYRKHCHENILSPSH